MPSRGPTYPPKSVATKCGLLWPIAKVDKRLRERREVRRVGKSAAVFLSGVLEYVVAEILEMAGNQALAGKKHRVTPQHISIALRRDVELNALLGNASVFVGDRLKDVSQAVRLPPANEAGEGEGEEPHEEE